MTTFSPWDAAVSSDSPTVNSIKLSGSQITPQMTRSSSRFFFNLSPGWNIAESSSKPLTSSININNGNSLKSPNSSNSFDIPADPSTRPPPAHRDATTQDFLSRYQQLKVFDAYRNELIEELLYRYQFLSEQYTKLSDDHDREFEYNQLSQRREKALQEDFRRLQIRLDQDPFVLILIDGDDMIFTNELLTKGELGGREAAILLHEKIICHLSNAMPDLQPETKIVTRIYANIRGLSEACYKSGIVDRPSRVDEFAKGFTSGNNLFDFIDVGGGKDRADAKVAGLFKLHLYDYRCRQIVLGCSYDNGYAHLLEELGTDQHTRGRITLLEGVPFEQGMQHFNLQKVKVDCLFRETKINVYAQESGLGNALLPSVIEATLPPSSPAGSVVNRRLGEMEIKDVKDFTPRLPQAREASISTDSAKPSPIFTWASAAAKPATPVAPPAPPAAAVASVAIPKDQIPRNRKGQRVDPIIKHDKVEVDRVKKLKMCNVHFLRNECPYGDACSHVHQYKASNGELQTLRLVARMAPCMHGSECEELKCIYGHICPAPEGRDGKDCIFGDQCRFPTEMHKIDRLIVKTIKV